MKEQKLCGETAEPEEQECLGFLFSTKLVENEEL